MAVEDTMTEGSKVGYDVFEPLNVEYENAYRKNPYKKACLSNAISLMKPGSRVLDVGCGTGVPVSHMLADADMEVYGFDISPKMVHYSKQRVPKGHFETADIVGYEAKGTFSGIFIIYSHLSFTYEEFHTATTKLAKVLEPGGLLAIGQSPTDGKVANDDSHWDETKTYVEGYNLPFWGKPFPTLMLSREGQKEYLRSMGLEIVYDTVDVFQPDHPACAPETQQYVIGRRPDQTPLSPPKPLPVSH